MKGDGTRGMGIGFARYKNFAAYAAVACEVEVERESGRVRMVRAAGARAITAGFIDRQSAYDVLVTRAMATVLDPRLWTVPVGADPNERNTAVLS